MGRVVLVFCWLLGMSGVVSAQTDTVQRALPNWLTGIVAVVVFLFLVFVAFLVNKAWCTESRPEHNVDSAPSNDYGMTNGSMDGPDAARRAENTYVNYDGTEDKVTVM